MTNHHGNKEETYLLASSHIILYKIHPNGCWLIREIQKETLEIDDGEYEKSLEHHPLEEQQEKYYIENKNERSDARYSKCIQGK